MDDENRRNSLRDETDYFSKSNPDACPAARPRCFATGSSSRSRGRAFASTQAYSTIAIALALYADLFGTTGTVEGLFGTAFAVCGIADSIRVPASMALFVEEGEHFDAVAGSLSLRSLAWKVGQVLGPVSAGALWDATDVSTALLTVGAFIVAAAVAFLSLYRTEPAPDAVATPGI